MTARKRIAFGTQFNYLTVIRDAPNGPQGRTRYFCRCQCGKECCVSAAELRIGHTKSCGCLRTERLLAGGRTRADWRTGNKHGVTHGKSHIPTYQSWTAMRSRCLNPNYRWYKWYGGKGVRICERWNDFNNFLADMGERPPGRSLDRVDSNGNYELGNCRWATKEEQGRNRSTVKLKAADVERIRDMISCGCKNTHIANYFGVHRVTVFDIRAARTWV